MKASEAIKQIKALGLSVKRIDGEFIIDYKRDDSRWLPGELRAYYCEDPQDAVDSAEAMSQGI